MEVGVVHIVLFCLPLRLDMSTGTQLHIRLGLQGMRGVKCYRFYPLLHVMVFHNPYNTTFLPFYSL